MSEFTIADLKSVFQKLHAANWSGILIGGQAVNLYAHFYASRIPNLESFRPLASRDLDFHGGPREARRAMAILHASGKINDGFDPSPNAGVLQVKLESGQVLVIDILTSVFGISASEMLRSSITWKYAEAAVVQVLHPLLLLESKLACLRSLDQANRQDRKHTLLMMYVVAAWMSDQMQTPRDVFKSLERVAAMMMTPDGLAAFDQGIDLWHSIPLQAMRTQSDYDSFFTKRLPQLEAQIADRRRS